MSSPPESVQPGPTVLAGLRRGWGKLFASPHSTGGTIAVLVAAILVIGLADHASGPTLSLSAFYLVPVAIGAVRLGRRSGLVLAAAAGVASLWSDVIALPHPNRIEAAWNTTFMVVTLVVLVEVLARLQERTREALAASSRSRDFLTFAAHQLRTPIAGIRSGADALALGGVTQPEADDLLSGLVQDADRASRLVSSLLRIARLDEHEPLPTREIDLTQLAVAKMERITAQNGRDLSWEVQRRQTAIVVCNPDAIGEAITNLLDNAMRHARTKVVVSIELFGDTVEINVTDDGPGLSGSAKQRVFERFVTLDGHGGTGLGLPIARGIAEAHGGQLDYRHGGFVLALPLRGPRHAPATR